MVKGVYPALLLLNGMVLFASHLAPPRSGDIGATRAFLLWNVLTMLAALWGGVFLYALRLYFRTPHLRSSLHHSILLVGPLIGIALALFTRRLI